MNELVELNQGEIKISFTEPTSGKVSLKELGLTNADLEFDGGLMRIVFDFEGIGDHQYYKMPLIELSYQENMAETHWQCDFNDTTILDKTDHHGHSTIVLLNRNKLSELEQHHQNQLILHGEFPEPAHLIADKSFIHFFK